MTRSVCVLCFFELKKFISHPLLFLLDAGQHVARLPDASGGGARFFAIRSSESPVVQVAYILTLHVSLNPARETEIRTTRIQHTVRVHERGFSDMRLAVAHVSRGVR